MRHIILLYASITLASAGWAQETSPSDPQSSQPAVVENPVVEPSATPSQDIFKQVFQAEGFTKQQIFSGVKIWIAENFKSGKAVLEYENAEEGVIIGNGRIAYPCSGLSCLAKGNWNINFTMRAEVKDARFRLSFTNLQLALPATTGAFSSGPKDVPLGEADKVRVAPKLQSFGPEIVASLAANKGGSDW